MTATLPATIPPATASMRLNLRDVMHPGRYQSYLLMRDCVAFGGALHVTSARGEFIPSSITPTTQNPWCQFDGIKARTVYSLRFNGHRLATLRVPDCAPGAVLVTKFPRRKRQL